jgi:hypothetical protein
MDLDPPTFYPHSFVLRNLVCEGEDVEPKKLRTKSAPTIAVRFNGLKRISWENGEVEVFSTTLQLPRNLCVSNIYNQIGRRGGRLGVWRVSESFKFSGHSSPISPKWVDVFTKPVEVISGRPCYDHSKGYKINLKQTLAEFFSKAFPLPVETNLFVDQAQIADTNNGSDAPHPATSVSVMTGDECGVSISFMRTLRIPEDGKNYPLPAGLGKLPLFNIQDFAHEVPPEMLAEGGIFLPMYRKSGLD